ncbi:MAG TPA: NUDIX domain-containing protein [Chitinophagales bacterium]|nr:NUDIX domain-containing protein [Chitinophagales bacterium]
MKKQSAGILLYRLKNDLLEIFLVHPGGPFWAKKEEGVWTIPKGEITEKENPLDAAKREFKEETGFELSGNEDFIELTPVTLKSGKVIVAWALQHDIDSSQVISNTFETEWTPKSGRKQSFPEIDKAGWFNISEARRLMNKQQQAWIGELISKLGLELEDAGQIS